MPAGFPIVALVVLTLLAAAAPATAGPRSSGRFPETLPALRAAPDPTERGGRIVDARGREVLLRGVNVNVLADHPPSRLPAVQPFTPGDLGLLRGIGFNLVRLQLSWSRIEPRPGHYDEAYLAEAERYIETFRGAGMYTILDVRRSQSGGGPAWLALPDALDPALGAAWAAFWRAGAQDRYVAMLAHVARRLGRHDALAGYDVLNEPAAATPEQQAALGEFYGRALAAIRGAERAAGTPPRLFLFQPDAAWSRSGHGAPPDFPRDRDVVYAPHVAPTRMGRPALQAARDEARAFGGAPVLIGEWGTEPDRGRDFVVQQDLQDTYAMGSALWMWREGCGDPRLAAAGPGAVEWGFYEVDCATNRTIAVRRRLVKRVTRAFVRAAPGRLHGQRYNAETGRLSAVGQAPARNRATLLIYYPGWKHREARFRARGLRKLRAVRTPGEGRFVVAVPRGPWSIEIGPRLTKR